MVSSVLSMVCNYLGNTSPPLDWGNQTHMVSALLEKRCKAMRLKRGAQSWVQTGSRCEEECFHQHRPIEPSSHSVICAVGYHSH